MDLMIKILVESFYTYYGLDWISFIMGSIGLYLISIKNKKGFIFQGIAVICSGICSIIANQYGFVFSSLLTFVLTIYGYINWKKSDSQEKL